MLKKALLSFIFIAFFSAANAAITPTPVEDLRTDSEDCYLIGTANELYGFAALISQGRLTACGKLTENIVVNSNVIVGGKLSSDSSSFQQWAPIGNQAPFMGVFDGQNHSISGLYVNAQYDNLGMFGFVSGDAQVKNLKVVDSYVSGANNVQSSVYCGVGGIVGFATGNFVVNKVSFSGVVLGRYYVGGIAGQSVTPITMNDVSFSGTVSGYTEVGGIVGKQGSGRLTITNASFNGTARAPGGYVGGIVGSATSYEPNALVIENAVSAGTIEQGIESDYISHFGGLAGYLASETSITNSRNLSSVKGFDRVGGLVGSASSGLVTLQNCYNSGDVVANWVAGGLVGFFERGSISNSYNVGSVTANATVGGLVGEAGSSSAIFNSFNKGSVSGIGLNVGAIVGDAYTMFMDNVFYAGEGVYQYGLAVSETFFENGILATVLHDYDTDFAKGSIWGQNVLNGETYPTLTGEVIGGTTATRSTLTLRVSDGSEFTDSYIEGISVMLPGAVNGIPIMLWSSKADFSDTISVIPGSAKGEFVAYGKLPIRAVFHTFEGDETAYPMWFAPGDELPVPQAVEYNFYGWYTNPDFTGEAVTTIPADATEDLEFYAKLVRFIDEDGCYLIATTQDLDEFKTAVIYSGGNSICGKLTANIVYNENIENWYPIGSEDDPFNGIFDGQGHTISGLRTTRYTSAGGLFGYVTGSSTIKNVGVENSYLSGSLYAGGIVGYVLNGSGFSLTNSYSISDVSVTGDGPAAGGLVGYLAPEDYLIANNFHIGDVSGARKNGCIVGYGSTSRIYNSYHDEASAYDMHMQLLDDGFKKGKVAAYLHNYNENGVDGSIWGQDPSKGELHPNFSGSVVLPKTKVVYHLSDGTVVEDGYAEGVETMLPMNVEGKSILAWYRNSDYQGDTYDRIYSHESGEQHYFGRVSSVKLVNGCYEISDAEGLYDFALLVSQDGEICGKLTKDIVDNENVLESDGSLNPYVYWHRQWTPIGSVFNPFKGTFDGQGHTISGLFFKKDVVEQYGSNRIGLFGYVESNDNKVVSIKNLVVKDSYIWGYENVGGIIGEARNVNLIVEACGFEGVVTAENSTAAGIIGYANETQMGSTTIVVRNSYNRGLLKSYDRVGGIIGATFVQTQVLNSYNMGTLEAQSSPSGQIIAYASNGASRLVENNFIIGSEDDDFGAAKSAEDFANGSVAELLHGYNENGVDGSIWGQDVVDGDEYPKFNGVVKKINIQKDSDGCYLIASADELYGFATIVNKGKTTACGKLTADIVVNKNVLDADGNLKNDISTYRHWTPIGNFNVLNHSGEYFSGSFDGQGHTIAGLVTYENDVLAGLFGYAWLQDGVVVIKNVGVVDSYIQGAIAAGIVGDVDGRVLIENVYALASVKAVVAAEYKEMIPEQQIFAGGIVGTMLYDEATIRNSFFVGNAEHLVAFSMPMLQGSSVVHAQNNFFLGTEEDSYGAPMSLDDFANGSVAALLRGSDENSIWGQNIAGGEQYPTFYGKIVKTEIALNWETPNQNVMVENLAHVDEFTEVKIDEGKQFYANGKIYEGVLTAEDIQELADANVTALKPISGVSLEKKDDQVLATLGDDKGQLIVPEDITVSSVDVNRTFNVGTYATVMYPFEMDLSNVSGLTFYELSTITQNEGVWTVTAEEMAADGKLMAHVPYLVKASGTTADFDGSITISANANSANKADIDDGAWSFRGTYVRKDWTADDPELPYAYGFVANTPENIAAGHQAGQFKKLGAGAFTKPMRAYLLFNYPAPLPGPRAAGESWSAPYSTMEMPEAIEVVIKQKETVVQSLQRPGRKAALPAVKANRWVDAKGRVKDHRAAVGSSRQKNGIQLLVK